MYRFSFLSAIWFRSFSAIAICMLICCSSVFAQHIRLRAQITPQCTSPVGANLKFADIFADGNIAVQGSYGCRGAFIYDITNPDAPVLASWYNPSPVQQFLEAIVVGNRGYFGSGSGGAGVHIVDLTDPYNPVLLGVVNSTHGNAHDFIHEMVVFEQNGAKYLVENYNSLGNRTLKIINVTDPANPVFVRDLIPTEPQWVHAMVVKGNRMFTSGWGNSTSRGRTEIYDVSNIATQAPTLLGYIEDQVGITHGNNMHSSWPSEDGNWLYSCRETTDGNGDVRVYNISNPAMPVQVNRLSMQDLHLNAVSPHNPVVLGNYLYVSWYQAGLVVFNISNPANPVVVGIYDTFPGVFAPSPAEKQALSRAEPWDMVCGSEFIQNELPTTYDGDWAVYPFLGLKKVLAGDLAGGLFIFDATGINHPIINGIPNTDFDGDGHTDLSVFSTISGDWRMEESSARGETSMHFGLPGDVIVPGDYDGDGKTDEAVFRPSTRIWYIQGSTAGFQTAQFGLADDIPVAGDFDADGRSDIAVFRPSTGVWYIQQSTLGFKAVQWGIAGDKPVTGDYDGDGKTDVAVWRPSDGTWYVLQSSSSIPVYQPFGQAGDEPLNADFDGNGVSDFAVYRPSTGEWYMLDPRTSAMTGVTFGLAEDIPVPADYDGDGKADVAVFRPSTNMWYRIDSSTGNYFSRQFGQAGDQPAPAARQPR